MGRLLFVGMISVLCIACSEDQPVHSKVNNVHPLKTTPQFFLNSDGTKTYLSSLTVCAEDIPNEARPHSCFGGASTIEFYAAGSGFVGFDKESLVINSLLINGIDNRKDRNLKENFKLGTFPRASDDGKYVSWSIDIKNGYYSLDDSLNLSGHLEALKSEELIELKSEIFNINDFESFKLGTVLVQGTSASSKEIKDNFKELSASEQDLLEKAIKKSAELGDNPTEVEVKDALTDLGIGEDKLAEMVSGVLAQAFLEALSSNESPSSADEISLTVKTDFSTLERVELYDGETKIKSSGWFGSKGKRSFSFQKSMQPNLTLKVFYWDNPERVKLNFDF